MGCDIHGVLQKKVNGEWITYREGYSDRNYNAFAILANVRNGYGFAGIYTGEAFSFIQSERGLPEDFSVVDDYHTIKDPILWHSHREKYSYENDDGEKTETQRYWMGDHSFGYVSARELAEFDFEQKRIGAGVVSEEDYGRLIWGGRRHKPNGWSGGISGANIVTISCEEYDELKAAGRLPPAPARIYVRTKWEETFGRAVGQGFMSFVHSVTRDAIKLGNLDSVRFVFGFDS